MLSFFFWEISVKPDFRRFALLVAGDGDERKVTKPGFAVLKERVTGTEKLVYLISMLARDFKLPDAHGTKKKGPAVGSLAGRNAPLPDEGKVNPEHRRPVPGDEGDVVLAQNHTGFEHLHRIGLGNVAGIIASIDEGVDFHFA